MNLSVFYFSTPVFYFFMTNAAKLISQSATIQFYCIVLCCVVLCCVVLCCVVLCCVVLCCVVLCCVVLYCIVLYCIVLYCIVPLNSDSCLTELRPRRHFYMGGQSLPITIETSDRASQQLSSHILRILLTEVLGYEKVEIRSGYNSMNATHTLNRLAGCNTRSILLCIHTSVLKATV